jgi:hypothetical protein
MFLPFAADDPAVICLAAIMGAWRVSRNHRAFAVPSWWALSH